MDVYLQNNPHKKVRLTQADFKAQGGEGAVYVQGNTAYKVYADPAKMIALGKIRELSVLNLPEIVRPQDVLLDARHIPIGYTMRSIPSSLVLCQTFSKAFRDRAGLTPGKVVGLVKQLQEGIRHIHSQGILIVDLNEMNFLVDPQLEHVYFIDVDSYQTKSFAATALMESVRDRHARAWNEGTDWFSFAVVSCQMFLGIHPYKGKHPTLKTLEERMLQNVSIFQPDVSLPGVCPPLSVIPAAYQDWYRAVLDHGERCAPPLDIHAVSLHLISAPSVFVTLRVGGGLLMVTKRREFAGTIISFLGGVTVTTEAAYLNDHQSAEIRPNTKIGLTPQTRHVVQATLENGFVRLFDLTRQADFSLSLAGEQIVATDGRLYVKQGGSLLEVTFMESSHQIWASAKQVGTVLEQATQLFEGVALQGLLGAWYASLLPESGLCHQIRLPEIDGFQVVAARFERSVLLVVAAQNGQFQKFFFRFSPDFTVYDVRVIQDLATYGINFVVLENGLCLHLSDTGDLEIFPARMGAPSLKVVTDDALSGDCLLLKDGNQALFAKNNCLYQMTMK